MTKISKPTNITINNDNSFVNVIDSEFDKLSVPDEYIDK